MHGAIDGYSHLIVFLSASSNNRADSVLQLFLMAVQQYNLPSRVRTDLGMENIEVARVMLERCGLNRGNIITGTSVHNQRIERLWREVNRIICSCFVNIFSFLEANGLFNPLRTFAPIATAHLYCAHHSLSTHVPRHFQAHALSRKLNKNIEPVTLALAWCANIFVGCSVTPNFFSADHFLFRFSPLY